MDYRPRAPVDPSSVLPFAYHAVVSALLRSAHSVCQVRKEVLLGPLGLLVIQSSTSQQVIPTWESPAKKRTEWRMGMMEAAWVPLLSMAE
ncbi:MAG: hypothetical protein LQ340_004556 [Diploschistes diacapsis]|nr:MAG: hypothetical protein LQ340_004556 [Diploschistes diacapsis]